jgi:hypothetical protein
VTNPTLLRITRVIVGRRASGFVQVAQCRAIRRGHARIVLFEWDHTFSSYLGSSF